MSVICNSAAPTGLNNGWGGATTQGFRSASPHCTPAYTLISPNGLLLRAGDPAHTLISPNGLHLRAENPAYNLGSPNGLLTHLVRYS